jgi:hypothetical protein
MVANKADYWIPRSVKEHKKGSLHKQMGIPIGTTIPFTLLQEIVDTPIGNLAQNPTQTGKDRYKVTPLLHARANWGLNLKRISRGNKK